MTGDETADAGAWVGGWVVRVDLPETDATVTGRVHGSTGYGRTRILVSGESDEKDTEILVPDKRTVEVLDRNP